MFQGSLVWQELERRLLNTGMKQGKPGTQKGEHTACDDAVTTLLSMWIEAEVGFPGAMAWTQTQEQ